MSPAAPSTPRVPRFWADDAKVAIKLNGNFPGNPAANGLPTVQGIIYLADGVNGRPLAVMDSIEVTINRTGAATTLAARHLARRNSRVATVCGAGVQGRIQLAAIAAAAKLERAHVWDINGQAAERLAQEMSAALKLDVRPAPDLSVVRESDIVVTCTSARRAFLTPELVRPGTFIAAVGADNSDKHEIDPRLYAASLAVVDLLEQAAEIGDLHHALEAGAVTRAHVHAEPGRDPGRHQARPDRRAVHHPVRQHRHGPAGRRGRCRDLPAGARSRRRNAAFAHLKGTCNDWGSSAARLDEWIGELSKTDPVVTYCVYGFHIGCETAIALRKAGFDARYMAGGHYAWKAIGGKVRLFD